MRKCFQVPWAELVEADTGVLLPSSLCPSSPAKEQRGGLPSEVVKRGDGTKAQSLWAGGTVDYWESGSAAHHGLVGS